MIWSIHLGPPTTSFTPEKARFRAVFAFCIFSRFRQHYKLYLLDVVAIEEQFHRPEKAFAPIDLHVCAVSLTALSRRRGGKNQYAKC